jgi:hypothetical protein
MIPQMGVEHVGVRRTRAIVCILLGLIAAGALLHSAAPVSNSTPTHASGSLDSPRFLSLRTFQQSVVFAKELVLSIPGIHGGPDTQPSHVFEGEVNCTALFALLDSTCGNQGWGCYVFRKTHTSCTNTGTAKSQRFTLHDSHSKCPLMVARNTSSLLRDQGRAGSALSPVGPASASFLVYQHIMGTQEDWEGNLLAVQSPYWIKRRGACMAPDMEHLIFVTDLLPLVPDPTNSHALKARVLDGMAAPGGCTDVCERLRAATAIIGSTRALNAQGFGFNDWKLSQWGYDANGQVILIDLGSGHRFADMEARMLRYVVEGLLFRHWCW